MTKRLPRLLLVLALSTFASAQDAPVQHPSKPSPAHTATTTPAPARTPQPAPVPAQEQPRLSVPPAVAPAAPAADAATSEAAAAERGAVVAGTYLPVGATLKIRLDAQLSTAQNREGDPFTGHVTEPVAVEGKTVVPVGAVVEGKVLRTTQPRRIKGVATITLHPEALVMPDGTRYLVSAAVVDTASPKQFDVDEEGRIRPRSQRLKALRDVGIGAGAGALVAAAIVHTPHATVVGAGIGAAAAFTRMLISRSPEHLPAETELYLELSRPLALTQTAPTQTASVVAGQQ